MLKIETEKYGVPLNDSENTSVDYFRDEYYSLTYINVKIYQTYNGENVVTSYIESRRSLNDEGDTVKDIRGIYIGPWYNITVEPYLTEYGAKHFASLEFGCSPDKATVEGFAVIDNKLTYHVLVAITKKVIVDESSGKYYMSTIGQNYFVDVQSGEVIEGEGYASGGDMFTPDDDSSFLPAFSTPALIIVAVAVTVVGVGGGFVRKRRKKVVV